MAGLNLQLLVPLAIFASSPLLAQNEPRTDEDEELRRYTVEMIVFKYNENVSVGTEVFVPDALPEQAEEFVFGDDVPPVDTIPDPVDPDPVAEFAREEQGRYELVMLAGDELTMGDTWGHLQRLDVYEPVMHFAWTQTTLPADETPAQPLSSFATPPRGLQGELKLYLGRYLHLVVDFALAAAVTRNPDYDPRFADDPRVGEPGSPTYYRIQEDRIFKSGEIRYFDHPKFGVLAKISRVEEEEAEDDLEEMLGDPALLGFERQ